MYSSCLEDEDIGRLDFSNDCSMIERCEGEDSLLEISDMSYWSDIIESNKRVEPKNLKES